MFFHEHKWVQVKDVWWNDKKNSDKKGFFLFCEGCHATCRISLYGDMPEFEYVTKGEKTKDVDEKMNELKSDGRECQICGLPLDKDGDCLRCQKNAADTKV